MSLKLSVSDLRAKYMHEIQHTDHVTALGLKLFDNIALDLQLNTQERVLLQTACELHDIGFAKNQSEHALASAQIVMNEGVAGLDVSEIAIVAAAILLHSRNYQKKKQNPLYTNLVDHAVANRIAAILRIADGLDHGHIQDAVIESIKKTKCGIQINVSSNGYPENIPWAEGKADLWEETFSQSVRIVIENREQRKNTPRYKGIVGKNDSTFSGARKLLMSQFRLIGDNRTGAIQGNNPEYLHDLRVAARRFHSALRFFKPITISTASREAEQALSAVAMQLGNARDAHVWMMFLEQAEQDYKCSTDPQWKDYFDYQLKLVKTYQDELARILESDMFWMFWEKVNYYLRIELPTLEKENHKQGSLRTHCAEKLLKLNSKLLKSSFKLTGMTAEELHDFRKQCRKARYWAEFAAPALGSQTQKYAVRLKQLADDMGDVHDMDVHMKILSNNDNFSLPTLENILKEIRTTQLKAAQNSWRNLNERSFKTNLNNSLKKHL